MKVHVWPVDQNMASLLTIPSNILWDYLIVGMLSVRDLALLDMAMANHKLRQSLKVNQ